MSCETNVCDALGFNAYVDEAVRAEGFCPAPLSVTMFCSEPFNATGVPVATFDEVEVEVVPYPIAFIRSIKEVEVPLPLFIEPSEFISPEILVPPTLPIVPSVLVLEPVLVFTLPIDVFEPVEPEEPVEPVLPEEPVVGFR